MTNTTNKNNASEYLVDVFFDGAKQEQEQDKKQGVRGTGFYEKKAWLDVRDEIKQRDKMTCQRCGRPIVGRYVVDHIEPLTLENVDDWNIAYNHENLQLLCLECHNMKTFRKETRAKSLW